MALRETALRASWGAPLVLMMAGLIGCENNQPESSRASCPPTSTKQVSNVRPEEGVVGVLKLGQSAESAKARLSRAPRGDRASGGPLSDCPYLAQTGLVVEGENQVVLGYEDFALTFGRVPRRLIDVELIGEGAGIVGGPKIGSPLSEVEERYGDRADCQPERGDDGEKRGDACRVGLAKTSLYFGGDPINVIQLSAR